MALFNIKNKSLRNVIGICVFVFIVISIKYFNDKKIENNGGYNTETIAIITSKSNYNKQRNTIYFEYQFQNAIYKTHKKNLSDEDYQILSVGDDIRIFINDRYPTYTKLDL